MLEAPPSYRRALRNRSFALLWGAQVISQSGDFVFEVALLWLVLVTTGSVLAVGIVVAATLLPAVVAGPFLGVLVDRWNRRHLLIGANLAQGGAVAVLSTVVLFGSVDFDLVIAVVLGLALGAQFARLASGAMLPEVVPPEDLGPANALVSFSQSTNQVVGLAVGGAVVGLFGVSIPIEYDAATFVAAALLLLLLPRTLGRVAEHREGAGSFRAEFNEGARFLLGQRFLVQLVLLGAAVNFFGNLVVALFAPYTFFVLHGGAPTYGALGATLAIGSIVGAAAVGRIDLRARAGRFLFYGAFAISAAVVLLGATATLTLALAEMFVLGVSISVANVPINVLVQAKTPLRLLGRVGAVLSALIVLTGPAGAYLAGAVASSTSIAFALVSSGAVMLAIVAVGFLGMRDLRDATY